MQAQEREIVPFSCACTNVCIARVNWDNASISTTNTSCQQNTSSASTILNLKLWSVPKIFRMSPYAYMLICLSHMYKQPYVYACTYANMLALYG